MKFFNFLTLFLVLGLLFRSDAYATINYYKAREGDSIQNIYNAFFQTIYTGNEINDIEIDVKVFAQNLKKMNPKITDWGNLKSGTIILLPRENINKPKFSLGIFYTASQGKFSEELTQSTSTITSSQLSPVTIGLMSQYQLENSNFVIPSSIYISKLVSSNIKGEGMESAKLPIPAEVGGNVYGQYSIAKYALSPFAGLDFEKFTTFNVADIENGDQLSTRQNRLIYLTMGVGHNFSMGTYHLYIKGSLSKSISSTTTSVNSTDIFKGYRQMLYLNIKRNGPFLVHFFYKHHSLEGPTKLKINRIGAGVGYFFF